MNTLYNTFRFPQKESLKDTWLEKIGRTEFEPTKWTAICSDHFESTCFDLFTVRKLPNKRRVLKDDAIPTIFKVSLKSSKRKKTKVSKSFPAVSITLPIKDHSDHSYGLPSQEELTQKLEIVIEENKRLKRQLKIAKQSKKRFVEKCALLKEVVDDLERKDCRGICGRMKQTKKRTKIRKDKVKIEEMSD